jgi:hypothetical protein
MGRPDPVVRCHRFQYHHDRVHIIDYRVHIIDFYADRCLACAPRPFFWPKCTNGFAGPHSFRPIPTVVIAVPTVPGQALHIQTAPNCLTSTSAGCYHIPAAIATPPAPPAAPSAGPGARIAPRPRESPPMTDCVRRMQTTATRHGYTRPATAA